MHTHLVIRVQRSLTLLAVMVAAGVLTAAPITYDVICGGNTVGTVSMDTSGTGISGTFTSSTGGPPPTLAAAAAACGEHHFNWYQVVTADTNPPRDAGGNQLMPPYVDPPPGGYQGDDWQDNLPWYWNETLGPGEMTTELSRESMASTLKFSDFPNEFRER